MKRIVILILSALLLLSAVPAASLASSAANAAPGVESLLNSYAPEELPQLWIQIRDLLRADGAYPFSELEKGDTGYEVMALQTQLKALGFYQKEIVDNFGNGTYNAVHDFEKANGLKVDGIASVADQQALFGAGESVPAADAALAAYSPEELLQLWLALGDYLRTNEAYPFVELKKGDVGYEVTVLQTRLKELDYYQKEIVDNFGNGTYDALRGFEQDVGLPVDDAASVTDQKLLFNSAIAAFVQQNRTNSSSGGGNSNGGNSGGNDAVSSATP